MGCDIHGCVERRVNGNWLMVDRISDAAVTRNYTRFGALAGVRRDGPRPAGVPADASESTLLFVQDWGPDGHNHSWLPLKNAADIFYNTEGDPKPWMDEGHYFGVEFRDSSPEDWRLIFWFDN